MSDTQPTTEAEASIVAALATRASAPHQMNPDRIHAILVPEGWTRETVDLERFLDYPRRTRGVTHVDAPASFIHLLNRHKIEDTLVYARWQDAALTAVFNEPGAQEPRWADHQAVLSLNPTVEWKAWTGRDGVLMEQSEFADFLETHADEIVQPDAATMMELAETFHARSSLSFKSAQILQNGARELLYDEQTTATAGRAGKVEVPAEFKLALAPWDGTEPYAVTARFRYRISGASVKLGYKLIRPEKVIQDAFEQICDRVKEETDVEVLLGVPMRDGAPF